MFNFLNPVLRSRVQKRLFGTTAQSAASTVDENDLNRIARNDENWGFYFGNQWMFQREDGEPLVTVNKIKPIIDKAVAFLSGGGFKVEVPKILENLTLPEINSVWNFNKKASLTHQLAHMGSVTGDVFILVTYQEPTELERALNPMCKGTVRLILLDSSGVIPVWNPLDVTELLQVTIVTPFLDRTVDPSMLEASSTQASGGGVIRRYIQTITKTKIIEYMEANDNQPPKEFDNILGELPVIHIRNMVIPREFYGMCDLDGGALDMQRELNEKATDMSDIINYNGSPITVIKGAKASALQRGPKQIWSGLPKDSEVSHLELKGNFETFMDYIRFIKTNLMELCNTPEESMGQKRHISNTSGMAMQVDHGPIIEKTSWKKSEYEPGIAQINRLIMRVRQIKDGLILPFDLCATCGGKIHVWTDANTGIPMRKCYLVDPHTFHYLDPLDAPVTVIRDHSFGREMKEMTFRQFKAEYAVKNPSYFDPAKARKLEDDDTPTGSGELRMKAGLFQLPEEPETFNAEIVVRLDPVTGARETQVVKVTAVPTGCKRPKELNPYHNTVTFESTLPKDKHLELGYAMNAVNAGLRSRKWAMTHVGVEHTEEETQQILKERALFGPSVTENLIEDEPATLADKQRMGASQQPGQPTPPLAPMEPKQSDASRKSKDDAPDPGGGVE